MRKIHSKYINKMYICLLTVQCKYYEIHCEKNSFFLCEINVYANIYIYYEILFRYTYRFTVYKVVERIAITYCGTFVRKQIKVLE